MSPIISVIITAIIVAPITWVVAVAYRKNSYESKIGSAEEKSREIIDEALKIAETKKREALLEAKEESLKTKNELEKKLMLVDRRVKKIDTKPLLDPLNRWDTLTVEEKNSLARMMIEKIYISTEKGVDIHYYF